MLFECIEECCNINENDLTVKRLFLKGKLYEFDYIPDRLCFKKVSERRLRTLNKKSITEKMSKPKVARTIEDARSWAASFSTAEKKESPVSCPHGTAVKIEIIWKGQVTDSIIACQECWASAPDWVRVD